MKTILMPLMALGILIAALIFYLGYYCGKNTQLAETPAHDAGSAPMESHRNTTALTLSRDNPFDDVSSRVSPVNSGDHVYQNNGTNLKGFTLKDGDANFTVDNDMILGTAGCGWYSLPVSVSGDFQIDFDVYGDSGDVDAHLLLMDDANKGIDIRNCPQDTDSPTLYIYSADKLKSLYDVSEDKTLATADSTHFPNKTWTHVTITKKGNTLTDNVGGQVITADLTNVYFPAHAHVGLGYYASIGGNGQIGYSNIRVIGADGR